MSGSWGGSIDHVAGPVVDEVGARQLPESSLVPLEFLLDPENIVCGQKPTLPDEVKADPERIGVVAHLLGRRAAGKGRVELLPMELVVGGDDILDGRAVLGFLEGERIDEDPLARYRSRYPLELGEVAVR